MDEAAALVMPPGVTMRIRGNRLAIAHDGPIRFEELPGVPLHTVVSRRGDVELPSAEGLARVGAAGTLIVHGDLVAAHVQAERIVVKGTIRAREVKVGAGGLEVGGGFYAVDLSSVGDVRIAGPSRADTFNVAGRLHAAELRADRVDVGGDLVVDGALASPQFKVGRKLQARGPVQSAEITVGGSATFSGRVHADQILVQGMALFEADVVSQRARGGLIHFMGPTSVVKGVMAADEIRVGTGRIQSDALIAPVVQFEPVTTGRVTLVDARNELTPSAVKGCLAIVDLEEMFGSAEAFLEERGVQSLRSDHDVLATSDSLETSVILEDEVSEYDLDQDHRSGDTAPDEAEQTGPVSAVDGPASEDTAPEDTAPEDPEPPPPLDEELEDTGLLNAGPTDKASQLEDGASSPTPSTASVSVSTEESFDSYEMGAADIDSAESPTPAPPMDDDDLMAEAVILDAQDSVDMSPYVRTSSARAAAPQEEASSELLIEAESAGMGSGAAATVDMSSSEPEASETVVEDDEAVTLDEALLQSVDEPVDPLHQQMRDIAGRISSCYPQGEEPPAITRLNSLISARDYPGIRQDLTDIWKDLLKFHQRRGLRIQPQVTTTFNQINSLVRKLQA